METKTLSSLFTDLDMESDNVVRLQNQLAVAEEKVQALRATIIEEPNLHDALTTRGVVCGDLIYKKTGDGQNISLSIEEYIEPDHALIITGNVGDTMKGAK